MKPIKISVLTAALLAAAWIVPPALQRARHLCPTRPDGVSPAAALPQFARRYGFECSVCHTTVPRLTQFGYEFRRAGFRTPDEYGTEAKFKGLQDVFGSKFVAQYQVTGAATDGTATNAKVTPTKAFQVPEFALYPFSGAYGKYWATRGEVTFGAETGVEQAYARATLPYKDALVWARAGIMHPFQGYGASDEALGNFNPLFWSNSAKDANFSDTSVTLMEQNQIGAEVGAGYKGTTVSLGVFNGYNSKAMSSTSNANNNHHDVLLFINQMLGDKAAVSAEYLNGKTDWGPGGARPADATIDATQTVYTPVAEVKSTWVNNYQRLAVYANDEVLGEKLNLLGGWEIGTDHRPDPNNSGVNSDKFNSTGWFVEAQSKLAERFVAGLRGETFRPSTRTAGNRLTAVTLTGVVPIDNFKMTVDYQVLRTQSAVGKDRTDNTVLAEWMYAF